MFRHSYGVVDIEPKVGSEVGSIIVIAIKPIVTWNFILVCSGIDKRGEYIIYGLLDTLRKPLSFQYSSVTGRLPLQAIHPALNDFYVGSRP